MRSVTPVVVFSLVSLVSLLAGCPGPQAHEDDELCEHLQEGPAESVTATATGEGPLVAADHTRYDVTLVAVAGGNGGSVGFAADEAGDFVIALDGAVPLVLTDSSGATVAAETTATSSEACTEIRGRYVVELSVGTYQLTFGPSSVSQVGLVVEHGAHAH